jgi:hypothetical protein
VLAKTFLQPYLRADYQAASFDAYRERSVSSLALRYDSLDSDTTGCTGGLPANWSIATLFGSFDPMLRLEYTVRVAPARTSTWSTRMASTRSTAR